MLGEEPIDDINGSGSVSKQKFSIKSVKAKRKFCLNLHYICE